MYRGSSTNKIVALAPLRQFMEGDFEKQVSERPTGSSEAVHRQIILQKTTIAYGIAQSLRQAARSHRDSDFPLPLLGVRSSIDNFVVRVKAPDRRSRPTWKDIEGVDMLSPRLSVNIIEPAFLRDENDGDQDDEMGRYLEAEFPSLTKTDEGAVFVNQVEEDDRCHSFGVLLYELFFGRPPSYAGERADDSAELDSDSKKFDESLERTRKKIQKTDSRLVGGEKNHTTARARRERAYPALRRGECADLSGWDFPSSLSLVIHNLLDCGEDDHPDNSYESLDAVINDLHLLLLDPSRFLFDHVPTYDDYGRIELPFREHQLYGRVHEVSLITEAFCRVSNGKSESLFIGGFSGSGKSRLVNGLTARIDVAGGYVLTHKFDQLSRDKSILEIVAMFNDLCLLIKEKSHQSDLSIVVKDLVEVFGSDWTTLARLIPNIKTVVPSFEQSADDDGGGMESQMNTRSISFTLQRFLRVVSSANHPVVLFLDDLQWCDNSALTVVESLLCDTVGPSCLFFVGTYRSNEVGDGHEIFRLEERLKVFGIPTTMISLEGLNPRDLNTMVSDALCIFPRSAEPLSDIIYQKTKGNPFFAISFVRSLVDGGLLEYSTFKRRWVWDENKVSSMDITGNVLHLLSSKMSGLSSEIQSALKVAACFGIKIKVSVVETLSTHPEHSDFRDNLDQVIKEGFMCKVGTSEFKFVHDKVREAAYSLIPEQDRDQYHYSLGMSLYSITNGKVADDMIFSIADQIKHGIGNLEVGENSELRLDMAKLYGSAGSRAVVCSDHAASCSYLKNALSLLPTDNLKSHNELSLRFSLRLAESCYSCGDVEKAQCILLNMTHQCDLLEGKFPALSLFVTNKTPSIKQESTGFRHTFEDRLPAYSLLARILLDRRSFKESCYLCRDVLSQLGEIVPQSLQPDQTSQMVVETVDLLRELGVLDNRGLVNMKEAAERHGIFMHFYSIMGTAAYFGLPEMYPFVACRMVTLTMKSGLCKHSIIGFMHFSGVLSSGKISKKCIDDATQIGKVAMSCWKTRYNSSEQLPNLYSLYYGFIAHYTEPLQTCADMTRQGFEAGMSLGDVGSAFLNAYCHIRTAIVAGARLPTLMERVDYYLKLTSTYQQETSKVFLSIFRGTISILIDKGESTSSSPYAITVPTDTTNTSLLESIYLHSAIQAFWQCHHERCQYYIDEFVSVSCDVWRVQLITFLQGVNSFYLMKVKATLSLRTKTRKAIRVVKTAASRSCWNFANKVHLLEAEQFSFEKRIIEAQKSYDAAISTARSSGFIHEEGLACELAGYHYKKIGDLSSALSFFGQAKRCYTEWGSRMKFDSVSVQFDSIADYVTCSNDPS